LEEPVQVQEQEQMQEQEVLAVVLVLMPMHMPMHHQQADLEEDPLTHMLQHTHIQ